MEQPSLVGIGQSGGARRAQSELCNMEPTAPGPSADADPRRLTLEAIYEQKIFEATHLREPHWMQDGRRFSYLERAPESDVTTLWIYDIGTGERKPIIDPALLKRTQPDAGPRDGEDQD